MCSTAPHPTIAYPANTLDRGERAMRCAPFQVKLFAAMVRQSVGLKDIAGNAGLQNQYTCNPVSELAAETELLWLIQVGLLRREVDGQGLTDSFRVTPLGRQLVQKWQDQGDSVRFRASLGDRLHNFLHRWLRLRF